MWQHNPKIERERVALQGKLETIIGRGPIVFDILVFSYLLSYVTRGVHYISFDESDYPIGKLSERYQKAKTLKNAQELIAVYDLFGRLAFCMLYLESFLGPLASHEPVRKLLVDSIKTKQLPHEDVNSELALLSLLLDKRKTLIQFISAHQKDCCFISILKHVKETVPPESPILPALTLSQVKSALANLLHNHQAIKPTLMHYRSKRSSSSNLAHSIFHVGYSKTDKLNGAIFLSKFCEHQDIEQKITTRALNAMLQPGSKLNKILQQLIKLKPSNDMWPEKIVPEQTSQIQPEI